MPKGIYGKIKKRIRNGICDCGVTKNQRQHVRVDEQMVDVAVNDRDLTDALVESFWLPDGKGWAAKQKLWDKTWPRTEWVWGAPPDTDGWTTYKKIEINL